MCRVNHWPSKNAWYLIWLQQPSRETKTKSLVAVKRSVSVPKAAGPSAGGAGGYIRRCASTSTMTLREGIPALSAWVNMPRKAAFNARREAAFRIRWKR